MVDARNILYQDRPMTALSVGDWDKIRELGFKIAARDQAEVLNNTLGLLINNQTQQHSEIINCLYSLEIAIRSK